MMMASSTIRPSTTISPKREIRLIVAPRKCIAVKVPRNAIGRPSATQKATRRSRRKARAIRTRIRPSRAFLFMRSSLCSMKRARSVVTSRASAPPSLVGFLAT
jgi:hypothetical protein